MDWESVLAVDTEEIEGNESLSEGLYSFFLHNGIPQDPGLYKSVCGFEKSVNYSVILLHPLPFSISRRCIGWEA